MQISEPQPAWDIPLADEELRLIGELCAIQGQIENDMQESVSLLLSLSDARTRNVLRATSLATNSETWLGIVYEKVLWSGDLRDIAKRAHSEIRLLTQDRNDFIHALFVKVLADGHTFVQQQYGTATEEGNPVARRVRSGKDRHTGEIQEVRDRAARLSCMMAHIRISIMMHLTGASEIRTPWHDKF